MPALTLKNVPDKLLAKLRKAAADNRRSLNQQALHMLAAATEHPQAPAAAAREPQAQRSQLDEWRQLCGAWRADEPSERAIGRIYARRTRGRKVEL